MELDSSKKEVENKFLNSDLLWKLKGGENATNEVIGDSDFCNTEKYFYKLGKLSIDELLRDTITNEPDFIKLVNGYTADNDKSNDGFHYHEYPRTIEKKNGRNKEYNFKIIYYLSDGDKTKDWKNFKLVYRTVDYIFDRLLNIAINLEKQIDDRKAIISSKKNEVYQTIKPIIEKLNRKMNHLDGIRDAIIEMNLRSNPVHQARTYKILEEISNCCKGLYERGSKANGMEFAPARVHDTWNFKSINETKKSLQDLLDFKHEFKFLNEESFEEEIKEMTVLEACKKLESHFEDEGKDLFSLCIGENKELNKDRILLSAIFAKHLSKNVFPGAWLMVLFNNETSKEFKHEHFLPKVIGSERCLSLFINLHRLKNRVDEISVEGKIIDGNKMLIKIVINKGRGYTHINLRDLHHRLVSIINQNDSLKDTDGQTTGFFHELNRNWPDDILVRKYNPQLDDLVIFFETEIGCRVERTDPKKDEVV